MKTQTFLKYFITTFFLLFVNSLVAAPTGASSELKSLLSPLQTLSGQFSQKVMNEQGILLQEAKGKVQLKKPGQFRWEMEGQDPRSVIADGKKVWDYDKELEQVTVQPFVKGQGSAPIFFLTGDVSALDKDFKVVKINPNDKGKCMEGCDACFELEPKASQGSFQWIRVGFKDKKLHEMELLDQLGQRSVFIFTGVVLNENIPAQQFQFKPPKGVDVVENS